MRLTRRRLLCVWHRTLPTAVDAPVVLGACGSAPEALVGDGPRGTSGRRRRATPLAPHEGRCACERDANTRTAYGGRRWVSRRGEGAWQFPVEPAG
jgi:hypothetical protein